jgi:hypothetical protein
VPYDFGDIAKAQQKPFLQGEYGGFSSAIKMHQWNHTGCNMPPPLAAATRPWSGAAAAAAAAADKVRLEMRETPLFPSTLQKTKTLSV